MQTLVNDSEQKQNVSPLDTLLKDYQTPLVVNPSIQTSQPPNGSGPAINQNISAPLNNVIQSAEQRFYKTGKKAGQPKPERKQYYNPNPIQSQPVTQGPTVNSQLISGALFITLIDLVLPLVISFVNNRFTKSHVKPENLKLQDDQRKELEKLADEVVKQLNLRGNPAVIFAVSMGGMYLMNFMLQKSLAETKKPVNPYDK